MSTETDTSGKGECPACHRWITTTWTGNGTLRAHGPNGNRCRGGGKLPMTRPGPLCLNPDHEPRAAVAKVTWPDGRFHDSWACRPCVRLAVYSYGLGDEGEQHPVLITPLALAEVAGER